MFKVNYEGDGVCYYDAFDEVRYLWPGEIGISYIESDDVFHVEEAKGRLKIKPSQSRGEPHPHEYFFPTIEFEVTIKDITPKKINQALNHFKQWENHICNKLREKKSEVRVLKTIRQQLTFIEGNKKNETVAYALMGYCGYIPK